ncbi:uncharacterized protein LOC120426006 isoform X2 [Culex pipiens pallens]|uniref:uncharacterized protein LOC120426006 isoform X2 n=1 Tax=Culex pipiens pallens TaxID=42434 RepID=UPI0019535692|nr:uncharacterized protein LOC120426006 isoform X2 [Culex pipiens pallens]
MSSQIPPLVCHTPPPDFGDEEDDLPDDDDEQDEFDDYGSTGLPAVASTSNLPTPIPPAFSDCESAPVTPAKVPAPRLEYVPDDDEGEEVGNDSHSLDLPVVVTATVTAAAPTATPRMESPPSLILSQHNFSENDLPSEDDQDDDEEFQDFAFHPHVAPEEDAAPTGAEDNLSIPSLHLDTELSKSTTPVQLSENEASERNLSPQEDPAEHPQIEDDDDDEDVPAELTTPVVAEELGCRFDDNTENDFTDFTTASNDARSSAVLEIPTANDVSFDDDFAQLESTPSADSNFVSGSRTTDFATFDADFSKFDSFQASFPATFDEPVAAAATAVVVKEETIAAEDPAQDDFDDFQEFAKFPTGASAGVAQPTATEEAPVEDADDDDFGEFSDFKQSEVMATPVVAAPAVSIPTSRSALFRSDSILAVITGMFPSVATPEEEQSDTGQKDGGGGPALEEDKVCRELRDMDSTQALSYLYNSSESNKALVRALGIDSRNILFGPKWNSSMPRFAANLSFSPLEPIKPTSQAPPGSSAPPPTIAAASNISNSNASVIPMTGKQEAATVRHHAFGLDPLQPPISSGAVPGTVPAVQFDWNSSGLVNPLEGVQEILQEGNSGQQQQQPDKNGPKGQVLDPKVAEDAGPTAADEVEVGPPEEVVVDEDGEEDDFEFVAAVSSSSSSSVVDPPASIPSVVRTIKLPETHIFTPSKGVSPVSRDSTDRMGPEVREYHDVEYSLEKTTGSRAGVEKVVDEEEFSEFQAVKSEGGHLAIGSEFNFQREGKEKVSSYSKPVFGRSPTEELEQMDDEFSDFQAAVPAPQVVNKPLSQVQDQQVNRSATSSPLLLSPSILLPQQAQPAQSSFNSNRITQINWPDPGVDADELARFEAAFPTPKVSSVPTISSNHSSPKHSQSASASSAAAPQDDDEWTDFVYSKPAPERPSPTNSSKSSGQQEEWTDFIYSTPPSQQSLSSSQNKFNFQNSFASGPKFSSWNSPQLPPPQFNSWNSNSSSATPHYYGQPPKVPTFPPTSASSAHPPPSQQRLPELSFITPNSTPSAMPTAGTKPMTHSFLSNVISSSSFTKK